MTGITELLTSQIIPGDNDRTVFNQVALAELAESIKANGLAQPITVRPIGPNRFEIVAGERRFRAISEILKWDTCPAIVRDLTDEQAAAIMLAENVHRVDLNPLDEAKAYHKRMEQFGWSVAETARQANVSDTRVSSRIKLLELNPDIQDLVANNHLPLGFAQTMSKLNSARQNQIITWLREQVATPTARTFNKMVNELYEQQAQDSMFDMSVLMQPQLSTALDSTEKGKLYELLPTADGLPDLPTKQGSMAKVLDDYITELMTFGQDDAAAVMMDFWAKAMRANYANMSPFESNALTAVLGR